MDWMGWKFRKIPKRLIVYWGRNQALSWLRYMTVKSFVIQNPEWGVVVLTPTAPVDEKPWATHEHRMIYAGKDWYPELFKIPGVSELKIDFSFWNGSLRSEVHRADYIRYSMLYRLGGVWSDMDVLWVRPLVTLEPSESLPADIDAAVCWATTPVRRQPLRETEPHHHIGVLMGAMGNGWWFSVEKKAEALFPLHVTEYQALGRKLLDKEVPWGWKRLEEPTKCGNLPAGAFYHYRVHDLPEILTHKLAGSRVPPGVLGIHWYGGHASSAGVERDLGRCALVDWARAVEAGHAVA